MEKEDISFSEETYDFSSPKHEHESGGLCPLCQPTCHFGEPWGFVKAVIKSFGIERTFTY